MRDQNKSLNYSVFCFRNLCTVCAEPPHKQYKRFVYLVRMPRTTCTWALLNLYVGIVQLVHRFCTTCGEIKGPNVRDNLVFIYNKP